MKSVIWSGSESLVLIRLANVLVERDEKQVEQVLTCRALGR